MTISLQKIYDRFPVPVQHALVSASGYQRNRTRYGRAYWAHRRWLADFDTWTLDRKLEHQRDALVAFINDAFERSPFYQALYADVDLRAIRSVDDLKLLPIVDKELLRANMDSVYTVPRWRAVEGHTGGTTGKSLVILMTPDDMMKRMAMLDHFKHRVGFEHRTMRRASFNGKHILPPSRPTQDFWRYNAACRQMIYSTFHITDANLRRYVGSLNSFKPHALDGFFTAMVDVANFIERNDLELTFRPVAIFPKSETVTTAGRALLERVFGCRVYDRYASNEGAPFVTECHAGRLHEELSTGVFEKEQTSEGVLVTSSTTHGTPLIRYQIGDAMTFGNNHPCSCGVAAPLVDSIAGRQDDFLYRADGARINAGNVANLFKNMPNALIRAQVVQERLGEVRILLETDAALYQPHYDGLLRDEFVHTFGPSTTLRIEHVDAIGREPSGEHRPIKNSVKAIT